MYIISILCYIHHIYYTYSSTKPSNKWIRQKFTSHLWWLSWPFSWAQGNDPKATTTRNPWENPSDFSCLKNDPELNEKNVRILHVYMTHIYILSNYTYSNGNYSFRHIVNQGCLSEEQNRLFFLPLAKVRPTMGWWVSYWKWDTDSCIFQVVFFSMLAPDPLSLNTLVSQKKMRIYRLYMVLIDGFSPDKKMGRARTLKSWSTLEVWKVCLCFISRLLLFGVTSLNLRHQATVPTLHRVSSGRSFHQLEP